MTTVSDSEFETIINDSMDSLPQKNIKRLNNVAITYEDEPTLEQRQKLHLAGYQTLFGLYEGVPLTRRGSGYNLVLPDKITIFKRPIEFASETLEQLKEQVRHTLWHEIAHYYGLEHSHIDKIDY